MRSIVAKVSLDVAELKRRAKEGGEALRGIGRDARDASRQASTELKALTKNAADLDKQIGDTQKSMRDLAREFAKTGDTTLLKQLQGKKSQLSDLTGVRSLLPSTAELAKAGRNAGQRLGDSIGDGLSTALTKAGPLAGGAGIAGAILAPTIGAAVAGAVVGAAGAGGVIGGVVLAARDPRVKSAGKDLGEGILGDLESRSRIFIDPTLKGINTVRGAWRGLGPDLDRIFRSASQYVDPLVQGAGKGIQKVVSGVADAVEKAGPVIDSFGNAFNEIGGAVGDVFTDLSQDAGAGASAIDDLTAATVSFVKVTGGIAGGLAAVKSQSDSLDVQVDKARYWIEDKSGLSNTLKEWGIGLDITADGFKKGSAEAEAYRRQTLGIATAADEALLSGNPIPEMLGKTGAAAESAADALDRQRRATERLANDLRAATDPVFGFIDAQDKVAAAQKRVASATRKHGENSDQAKAAVRDLTRESIGLQEAAGKLGTEFDGTMTPALRATLLAAGASEATIGRLAGQFKEAKKQGDRFSKEYRARVRGLDQLRALGEALAQLPGRKDVLVALRVTGNTNVQSVRSALDKQSRNAYQRTGGVMTAMAAGGTLSAGIYPASNPPLVKFAEAETGGEAYIPRNGSRSRNLEILSQVASWPSVNAALVPMAQGGIAMAGGGYVNVSGSASSTPGTALDTAAASLDARNAVRSLSDSLKENGRSFSESTKKGSENRGALIQGIRAAQDAAQAKYAETGSVAAANREYDKYLRSLRNVIGQQKASAATLRQLSQRPSYDDQAGPRNSAGNIAYVQSRMALADAKSKARTFFDASWGKPDFHTGTSFGRDNLSTLFEYLGSAEASAQARYAQTGSAKSATRLYTSSLASLRSILAGAGMKKSEIDALLASYGRITLANREGGIYPMAGGGLSKAGFYPAGGKPLYQFAEPGTGGEWFLPLKGDKRRGQQLLAAAAPHYDMSAVAWKPGPTGPAGGGGARNITVTAPIVMQLGSETIARTVRLEIDTVLGEVASANVYETV
ncbi:hypothetical protein GCM10010435_44480 [Winogradskya consettensis]|uniref:Uncharacterized protein n=1 Tax=Winogradskya consettensis TaxID=113560 RepID=A0A919VYF6_9ACTN|nr:hypothetical protein [Actinoplanes consettensis]GIM82708.1 hypothetical protein Aco04nite_82870 [Actinoplanes consettensis]